MGLWALASAVQAQGGADQAATRDFNAAAVLQNEGLYSRAAEKWTAFLQQHPGDDRSDRAGYYLGICHLHQKKYRDAVQVLRTTLDKRPDSANADAVRYNLATALFQIAAKSGRPEDYRTAADRFAEVAARHPNSKHTPKALYLQGESLISARDLPAAIDAYKKLVALGNSHPLLADAYYALGTAQQELGRDSDAASTFQAFLDNSSLASHELATAVRVRLGLSLLNQKKYDEAERALAVAAGARKPASAEAAYWRTRALLKLNRPQEALQRLDEVMRDVPSGDFRPMLELARADVLYELPDRRKETPRLYEDLVKRFSDHALTAQATYMAALSALGEKDLPAARRHAEAFLANSKLSRHELTPAVIYVAAESCLLPEHGGRDLPKAEQLYRRLIDQYPQHARAHQARLRLAWCLALQKRYDEAADRYNDLLRQSPPKGLSQAANYGLAEAWYAKGEYEKALAPLNTLLSGPVDVELASRGRYLRGLAHHRLSRFDAAVQDLEAAVNTRLPSDEAIDAPYLLVLCRIALGQLDRARLDAVSLTRDRPNHPLTERMYYELGHALLRAKRQREAAEAFRTLAENRADSPLAAEGWFHVGRYHEEEADRVAAEPQKETELRKTVAAYASGVGKAGTIELREKIRYKLADVQFRLRQYDQAADVLNAQLAERPNGELSGPARFLLAESWFRREQFDRALPLFLRVADEKVEKCHAQSVYRAGDCAARLKQWSESEKHYRAVLGQFPKFELTGEARYGLALALQNQGKRAEARTLYEQAAKETNNETAAKAHFMLGEIAVAEQKYLDAIEQHLLVATAYPFKDWQAMSRFEIGRCYQAMGEKAKAVAAFQLVVDRYRDHAKAAEAAKLLEDLKR